VHTLVKQKITEQGLNDDTVLDHKRGKIMGISYEVGSHDHKEEEANVDEFVSLSEQNKKQNNDEHLNSNKDIFAIKTERISSVNAIPTGQYIGA
jgi:hypothetical protein